MDHRECESSLVNGRVKKVMSLFCRRNDDVESWCWQTPDADVQQGQVKSLVGGPHQVGQARLLVGLLVPPDSPVGMGEAGPHVGGLVVSLILSIRRSPEERGWGGGGWRNRRGRGVKRPGSQEVASSQTAPSWQTRELFSPMWLRLSQNSL